MTSLDVSVCQYPPCRADVDHPERELHRQINLLLSRLDEHQWRWFATLESNPIRYGGDHCVSDITGLDEKTMLRG